MKYRDKSQSTGEDTGKEQQKFSDIFSDCLKPFPFEMITCKEEWEEYKNSGNTEKISEFCRTHQKSGKNSEKHMAFESGQIRGDHTPEKQCHDIPERKLGTVKIQSGIFMDNKYIEKIVKQFINKIRNNKFLYKFSKRSGFSGKIT